MGILGFCLATIFLISGIYIYSQKTKQLIILNPSHEDILNIWDETTIMWEPIPGTTEYFVSIFPNRPGMYDVSASYQFFVGGNKSGVKLVLGNYMYGTGEYCIAVSSDVTNSRFGEVAVYLVDGSSAQQEK